MITPFASHTYAFILACLLYLGGQLVHAEHVHSDAEAGVAVLDCALCSLESVSAVSTTSPVADRLEYAPILSAERPYNGTYRIDVRANATRAPPLVSA